MTPERIKEIIAEAHNEDECVCHYPNNKDADWLLVAASKIHEEHTKEINAAWDLGYADGKKMQKLSDRLDSLSQPLFSSEVSRTVSDAIKGIPKRSDNK